MLALEAGKIAQNQAKVILSTMLETGQAAEKLIKKESEAVISDSSVLDTIVKEIFTEDPSAKEKFFQGNEKSKQKVSNFIMGQIMKKTQGKVKPNEVKAFLSQLL